MSEYDDNEYAWYIHPYSTHRPFLETYVKATTGDVLEFGAGYGSTGFLRSLLQGTGRKLVTIEDNPEWITCVKEVFPETDDHRYICLERKEDETHWDTLFKEFTYSRPIGVVFVDQTSYKKRALTCETFKGVADYIVIHDANHFPEIGLLGTLKGKNPYVRDEALYDFSQTFGRSYKLYFPPSPWSEKRWGPPTLVGTTKGLPIFPYEEIQFHL